MFRKLYDKVKTGTGISFEGQKSKTQQQFKTECDINHIMKRFEKTGILPTVQQGNPRYGDFSSVPDYFEACNIINKAQEQFFGLPAKVRERFDNEPAKFLDFVSKEENVDEMVKLGLAIPKERKEPINTDSGSKGEANAK